MTASSRGSRAAASMIRSSKRPHTTICSECISHLSYPSRRTYAIAATTLKTDSPVPDSTLTHLQKIPPVSTHLGPLPYKTKAGVLLSRPPLLTARQTPFEKAFFFYQKRLNERLAMPFTRYFYYKKGSPADLDRKIKERERNFAPQRELGGYVAYGEDAWNDELLVKEKALVEPGYMVESLVREGRVRAVEGKDGAAVEVQDEVEGEEGKEGGDEVGVGMPLHRLTEADRRGDVRRLDRALSRTLYLVVKRRDGGWGFPAGELIGRESLHQAAERVLVQTAGMNMNTWMVGHAPIGHHVMKPRYNPDSSLQTQGAKTFFMKARIMAGQADIAENPFGVEDYKWLTRQEIEKLVADKYYSYIKNMLAVR